MFLRCSAFHCLMTVCIMDKSMWPKNSTLIGHGHVYMWGILYILCINKVAVFWELDNVDKWPINSMWKRLIGLEWKAILQIIVSPGSHTRTQDEVSFGFAECLHIFVSLLVACLMQASFRCWIPIVHGIMQLIVFSWLFACWESIHLIHPISTLDYAPSGKCDSSKI